MHEPSAFFPLDAGPKAEPDRIFTLFRPSLVFTNLLMRARHLIQNETSGAFKCLHTRFAVVTFNGFSRKAIALRFSGAGTRPQSDADPRDVGPASAWHHRNKRLTPVKWWSNASSELRLFKSGRPST